MTSILKSWGHRQSHLLKERYDLLLNMDNTSKIPTQGHFSSVHNSVPRSSPAQDNAPTIMREESEESSPQTESTHTTFDRPRLGRDQNPHSPSQRQFHYFLVFSVQHIERSSVKNPIVQFDVKVSTRLSFCASIDPI